MIENIRLYVDHLQLYSVLKQWPQEIKPSQGFFTVRLEPLLGIALLRAHLNAKRLR